MGCLDGYSCVKMLLSLTRMGSPPRRLYEGGRLYIDGRQIYETDSGSFLSLSNGEILAMPRMSNDSMGSYLITLDMVNSKFFKNVCNKCYYEWSGGVFDIWCPKCGSTDWGTVRDHG